MHSDDENTKKDSNKKVHKEPKEYKSKGLVSEDKMKNKKEYKEAKRKTKLKSKKGLASTGGSVEHQQKPKNDWAVDGL